MKMLKFGIGLLSLLAFSQFIGYKVVSKKILFDKFTRELGRELPEANFLEVNVLYSESLTDTAILQIDKMRFFSEDTTVLKPILLKEFSQVKFIVSDRAYENGRHGILKLNYYLFNEMRFFRTSCYETIYAVTEDEAYVHVYRRKIMWILFFWWEYEYIDLGQS